MRAAVALRDVVGEALHDFGIAVVPLHCDIDGDIVFFAAGLEALGVQHRLALVHVFDEAAHAAGVGEVFALAGAVVDQFDLDAVVQERQFAQALGQNVVMEIDVTEDFLVGEEVHLGAFLLAFAQFAHWGDFDAFLDFDQTILDRTAHEFQAELLAVPIGRQLEPFRQAVDAGDAHAVQAAGNFVAVLVEFAAGVQHGKHDLGSRTLGFVLVVELDADGDTPAVIRHGDRVIAMNDDLDIVAMPGQRFVDGVVHHLKHHVMQARTVGSVADVHAGTLAHGLQTFKLLDARFVVILAHGFFSLSVSRGTTAKY